MTKYEDNIEGEKRAGTRVMLTLVAKSREQKGAPGNSHQVCTVYRNPYAQLVYKQRHRAFS